MNRFYRSRKQYIAIAMCVMVLGLFSRTAFATSLPGFVADYAGDLLWALLVYLLVAIIRPTSKPSFVAVCAAAFALSIELSQLFEADWADRIRDLPGMRLVFGYGFLWSDLACYAAGIACGWVTEQLVFLSQQANAHEKG